MKNGDHPIGLFQGTFDKNILTWHQIFNYAPHIFADERLQLFDGGLSENLAALPLIRRGLKNVIIVDAEHDPFYEFGSYKRLQAVLDRMGVKFEVPEIEMFMKAQEGKGRRKRAKYSASAVSLGTAKSSRAGEGEAQIDSRIHYIKMSKPPSVFLPDPDHDQTYISGAALAEARDRKVEARKGNDKKDKFYCDGAIRFGVKREMYMYIVNRYSRVMDSKKLRNIVNKVLPSGLVSDFPQTTTVDQSYYRDQLEAFVGLGYLQALELDPRRE